MNLYLLGGSGKKNIGWVRSVDSFVKDLFDSTKIQRYDHWNLEEKSDLDLYKESRNLAQLVRNEDGYIIFAKSAGILVTLKAVKESNIQPKACVFCGFPLLWFEERGISAKAYLHGYAIPTTFIQNHGDPLCSSEEMKKILEQEKCKNYRFIEEAGDTHKYNDLELIKTELKTYQADQ